MHGAGRQPNFTQRLDQSADHSDNTLAMLFKPDSKHLSGSASPMSALKSNLTSHLQRENKCVVMPSHSPITACNDASFKSLILNEERQVLTGDEKSDSRSDQNVCEWTVDEVRFISASKTIDV